MSNLSESLTRSLTKEQLRPLADDAGSSYTPRERINNAGFATNTIWVKPLSQWTIAGGVATSTGSGDIYQTFVSGVIPAGDTSVAFSYTVPDLETLSYSFAANGVATGDAHAFIGPESTSFSGTVTAPTGANGIIFSASGAGCIIDNVSVIA